MKPLKSALRDALVIRLDARGCLVRLDEPDPDVPEDGRTLWCAVAGRVHLRDRTDQKAPVAVGDRVRVRLGEVASRGRGARGGSGAQVEELHPRRSLLSRPAAHHEHVEHVLAANVDQVLIVSAAAEPAFSPALVDRFLAVVEWSRLAAVLVVNKLDLVEREPDELAVYRALGYCVVTTSVVGGQGVDELQRLVAGKISVVAGHSGVGKSSLLNAVAPGADLTVGAVNANSGRGSHTTTGARMLILPGGGGLIDTAGIREFGLFKIPARELAWLYRDLAAVAPRCRFPDCSHTHEPGCAVLPAVESGQVAAFRYDSYLRILESMR